MSEVRSRRNTEATSIKHKRDKKETIIIIISLYIRNYVTRAAHIQFTHTYANERFSYVDVCMDGLEEARAPPSKFKRGKK